jgi:hypothetical protein
VVALLAGVVEISVGVVVSITIAFPLLIELTDPGSGRVSTALFPAESRIEPEFVANADEDA